MARDNSSKYAILGLLTIEPMSGYDIRKFVRETLNYFWNESYGRIYPILGELLREGLATKRLCKQKGKPDRHVYCVTGRGQDALKDWLRTPPKPLRVRNEATLKLFLGSNLPAQENIRAVERQRHGLLAEREALAHYEKAIAAERDGSDQWEYFYSALRIGQLLNGARIQWCDEVIARLAKLDRHKKETRQRKKRNR